MLRFLPLLPILLAASGCGSVPPNVTSSATAWSDLASAREAAKAGDRLEAIRLLTRVVAAHPDRVGPRRRLGRLLLASGSPRAARVIAPLARRRPADPEDIVDLGFALLLVHDTAAARTLIGRLAAVPGDVGPRAYVLQARISRLDGDPAGAERALRHALVLDPGSPEALAALIRLAREHGDEDTRAEAVASLAASCPWHPAVRGPDEGP